MQNLVLMAVIMGLLYLLCVEIMRFSASLDDLTWRAPSETFIAASRLGASMVILLISKEVLISLKAGLALSHASPHTRPLDKEQAPLVSVIVPAYNEGQSIEATLQSISRLDYPRLEVICVDDGSNDDTLAKALLFARKAEGLRIEVLTQPNSGKWMALNRGIAHSTGDLILCVDADSEVGRDALLVMVPHFEDPRVAAVSGQVQVGNQVNILTRLQALEYVGTNGSARIAQSDDGCVLIVPGPIGLFRRSVLDDVTRTYFGDDGGQTRGPFSEQTFAEDFELSVMICALGHRIVYEPAAVSRTQAPLTIGALIGQRYRWLRGSMQVARRYYGEGWSRLGSSRPFRWWMALSTLMELYIVPIAGLTLLITMVWTLVVGELESILWLWMLVWLIHGCMAAMFIRSHGERLSLCLLAPLQGPYSVVILTGVWMHSVLDHARSRPMRW